MCKNFLFYITVIWMISSSNSAILQCQWNGDVCQKVISITPITQVNEVITLADKPLGYVNTLTTGIDFSNFYLKYVPTDIFRTFPNLQWIQIYNSFTTALMTDSFQNCAFLVSIAVMFGNISYVSDGFAQSCINTERVYLRGNNIEFIDKNAFRGLVKLNLIDLKENKITCLPPDLFQSTPLIQNIFLEKNKIAGIDKNLFRSLKYLFNVNFEDNLIRYLPTLNLTQSSINSVGMTFYRNPIIAIKPDFCSVFATRSLNRDVINLKTATDTIPCLAGITTFFQILSSSCTIQATTLKYCYGNYSTAMSDSIPCELGPFCIPGFAWIKLLDFLRSLNF